MTSHEEVARAWANGQKLTGSNMYTDGDIIFSWGSHFPIAVDRRGTTFFNTDKYSSSTSTHQSLVRGMCGDVVEVTTDEIKNIIAHPNDPVILTRYKDAETDIRGYLRLMEREFLKLCEDGTFPYHKIMRLLTERIAKSRAKDWGGEIYTGYLLPKIRLGSEYMVNLQTDEHIQKDTVNILKVLNSGKIIANTIPKEWAKEISKIAMLREV